MRKDNLSTYLLNTASSDKWERIGTRRRAGVLVPLFSVYSRNSLGIGDFDDLRLLIDWAHQTGHSILQLLPLNELGPLFCPYDALSSFALEPAYISLRQLSYTHKKYLEDKIRNLKKMFPSGRAHADYRIKQEKLRVLWDIFLKEDCGDSQEFHSFQQENSYWLKDFAIFKVLKDGQGGKPWYEWGDKFKNYNPYCLDTFLGEYEKEITFQMWVQWQLYRQFREAKRYADSKNVLLKGDLPLLVSRDSADVWVHQEFFKLDFSAGAPADMYCAKGQRWGMPTYNWENISRDGFRYLKEKLGYAENFYDILRIDHVVGLFRIWSIPYNEPPENKGLNGFFDPLDENVWAEHGRKILSVMLESTKMLLCAEDLGLIPKVCPQVIAELGILGNDVQRWVKDWDVRHDFLLPEEYRFLAVAMLSTHDTTNFPAWWENEAGTIDEGLFIRKCVQYGIDYNSVRHKLFNPSLCRHGRLRWADSVSSVDILRDTLGKKREELADVIEMYENSCQEKEKLYRRLNLSGRAREAADADIVKAAIGITLESRAIFCIQLITDWLALSDILGGDYYHHRINTPGTISEKNWSWVMPISLEALLRHPVCREIKEMVVRSGRI